MDTTIDVAEAGESVEKVADPSPLSPALLPTSDTLSSDVNNSNLAETPNSSAVDSGISIVEAVETKQVVIAEPSTGDSPTESHLSESIVCTVAEEVTVAVAVKEEEVEEVKQGEGEQSTETKVASSETSASKASVSGSESDSSDSEDEDTFRQSLLRRGVKEGEAKSNAFEPEDSDDDFDRDIQSRVNNMIDAGLEEEGPSTTGPPRTVNEEEYHDDPSLPATAPESVDLVLAGRISTLLPSDILVISADHTKTWDVDSVLCLKDGSILGRITELIGRVDRPSYRILIETTPPKQKNKDSSSHNKNRGKKQGNQQANKNSTPAPTTVASDIPIANQESTTQGEPTLLQETGTNEVVTEKESTEILESISGPSEAQPQVVTEVSITATEITTVIEKEETKEIEVKKEDEEVVQIAETSSSMDVDVTIAATVAESDVKVEKESVEGGVEVKKEEGEESEASKMVSFYARRKALKARLSVGEVVLCVVDWSKEVNATAARAKGSDASNVWDEEVGDDEVDFSDDEEERKHKERLKNERKQARANGLDTQSRGRGGNGHAKKVAQSGDSSLPPHPKRAKLTEEP